MNEKRFNNAFLKAAKQLNIKHPYGELSDYQLIHIADILPISAIRYVYKTRNDVVWISSFFEACMARHPKNSTPLGKIIYKND